MCAGGRMSRFTKKIDFSTLKHRFVSSSSIIAVTVVLLLCYLTSRCPNVLAMTSPVTAPAWTYTTKFPLNENPISENGNWINGGTVGLDWGNVLTTGTGTAEAAGSPSAAYSDPTAVVAGTWGPNQTVTVTVYSNGVEDKPNQSYDKEVEIRLRTSISAHKITGYEVNCRTPNDSYSYIQIVRWNGNIGDFTSLNILNGTGCANGDVLKATITGSTINVYRNGTLMLSANDSTFTTGNPGIGFNFGCGSAYNQFGLTSFTATDGSGTAPSPPTNLKAN
jgi:hypothetical protein